MASVGSSRTPHIGSPFASTPADTLDSHLLTQSLSLFSFSTDFLAPESHHRDWSHLVGPLAAGLPIHLIPFCQLIHTPRQQPTPTLYALPYSNLPIHVTQRLSNSHTLLLGVDVAAEAATLPQMVEAAVDSLRIVSAVESPTSASMTEESRYWQWTGLGRYSSHIGATARLPAVNLASLSPSLSHVVPYVSTSFTATSTQSRLALSHASFRAHVRPLAAAGDRGLLTAETLVSRGVDETWANLRLAYTHRLSESEPVQAALSGALDTVRDVQNKVQSTAAEVASPGLLRRLNDQFNSTVQPAAKLAGMVSPALFPPPPPPRPLLAWPFPSYLSFGLSHSAPLPSSLSALSAQQQPAQPRSFRLTDRSSSWLLSGLSVGVGVLVRPQSNVAVQLECGVSEQRVTADGRLWFGQRRRGGWAAGRAVPGGSSSEGMESVANGMFLGGGWVTERRHPQQSHASLVFGLSYMY